MAEVRITVRGSAELTHPPELATVHIEVAEEGGERAAVHRSVSETATRLAGEIAVRAEGATPSVTRWSSEQVRTWSYREPTKFGGSGVVHHAAVAFEVCFVPGGDTSVDPDEMPDFGDLDAWLSAAVALSGVEMRHIDWALTDAHRTELTDRARTLAVRDAHERAAAYARDLNLATVRPVEIADPGLLGTPGEPPGRLMRAAFSTSGGMEVELRPQPIVVRAEVDARFVAE